MEGGILILLCWGKYLCKISLMPFWVNFQKSGLYRIGNWSLDSGKGSPASIPDPLNKQALAMLEE
jgi:hypothetical protein